MRRSFVVIALLAVFLSGCSTLPVVGGPYDTTTSGSTKGVEIRRTIPALELVPLDSFADSRTIQPGSVVSSGSYKPLLSGSHLTSVEWLPDPNGDPNAPMLSLVFDVPGAAAIDQWTSTHNGAYLAFVLGGTVIDTAQITFPIEDGAIPLTGPRIVAARPLFDAKTVIIKS